MGIFNNRRKLSGIVVDSKALLRFAVPFVILITTSVVSIVVIHWQIMATLMELESLTNYDPAAAAAIAASISKITQTGMIGMFMMGIFCMLFWIFYSHRIFGPTVPFRRHIQSMIDGKYESRIRLRRFDEFKEIASDLNRLAEQLGSRKS